MTPRELAEKLYQSLNCHMVTPQIVELDVKLIERALIEAREQALEEAMDICSSRAYQWYHYSSSFPSSEVKAWAHDEAVHCHDSIRALKSNETAK